MAEDVSGDLPVQGRLTIPGGELRWTFSRSSGPGGQSVNTTDSRVGLAWDASTSTVLSEAQRDRLTARPDGGLFQITASEHRSQWQNRRAARERLADAVRAALAPPPRARRATRPTAGSRERRLAAKKVRAQVKHLRRDLGD